MPLNPGLLRLDLESLLHHQLIPIPHPPGTVQIVTGPGVIVFKLNNAVAWTIDEKLFGGMPVLTSGPVKGDFRIELKGALYPGTSLSADFVCILAPKNILGTPMDMSMTLGRFHGDTNLERWLAGSVALTSAVTLNDSVCPLGSGKLTCKGTGSADFAPSWKTALSGGIVTSITGHGAPQDSDAFTLRLLTPLDPSLRGAPKNKRTLMTLARRTQSWDLKPAPLVLPIGKLAPRPNVFDRIDIEAGENSAADTDHTLLAQSQATDKLQFAPSGGLTDPDGKPLVVALAAPRYAIDFETHQTILTAHFPDGPVWMRAQGFAMEVRDPGTVPAFEVDATNGTVTTIVCAPVLLQAAAPLAADLAARPLPVEGAPRLPFVAAPGPTPGWGVLAAKDVAGQPKVSLPQFAVAVLRPRDLLSLEFDFLNLALEGGTCIPPRLARVDRGKDAFVIARFNAPQNIAEQAFFESAVPPPVTGPPVLALAAGPSRLAFKLGAGVDSVDYSVANLLDWKQYDLNVARAAALPDPPPFPLNPPAPVPPQANETAIEAPWRLVISPNSTGGFAHAMAEVTHGDQTELWHTRLGVKKIVTGTPTVDEQDAGTRKIRALWSPDFKPGPPPIPRGGGPFLMSLDTNDRDQIVVRSSDFSIPNLLPPKAVDVDRLMLSSLGAWMDVDGRWTAQDPFDVEEWRHRAAMGRDSYVKVVHAGHLCPFGHRAVLVVVTERKFLENPAGNTTAYLIKREFIVVKEPEKDYGYLAGVPGQGRNFPYRTVRITTLVTPNLDPNNHLHFFPKVGTTPFLFHLTGTDREGRTSEFTAPLVWTSLGEVNEIAGLNDYVIAPPGARKRDMGGQQVAFAQSSKPGDTSLHTSTMTFSGAQLVPAPPDQPSYYPILNPSDSAEVTIPALQQINGSASTVAIKLFPDYVTNDFKKGGVFLELLNPLGVAFGGDKTGGVATPDLNVGGLSRSHGTVSGAGAALDTFAKGKFDPADYFGSIADAKLLGFIPLTAIIDVIPDVTATPEKAPKLVTTRTATEIVTNLAWKPDVHDWSALSFAKLQFTAPPADPANPAHMEIDVVIRTPIGGGNPDATVHGHLRTFDLELVSVIVLHFKSVSFTAQPGKKLDLTADLATPPVEFAGDLSFLNQLQKLIPSSGFSDPPSVDVTSTGVTVGYSLAIPSVGVGVFSVENIRFSAALELSFVGDPLRFRLAFSEREHPFLVTVSLLGGGGFFALHLGPDGIEMLEASIEFGANVSLDLVVASANVHIMAGVYLKLDFASNTSQLTGYLRAGGSANVLGLITVSVEFYLGFTYYFGPRCKIAGEASVTVEIDILFFSASVSVSLRREFEDPQVSFADLIRPADWDHYCDAFAA